MTGTGSVPCDAMDRCGCAGVIANALDEEADATKVGFSMPLRCCVALGALTDSRTAGEVELAWRISRIEALVWCDSSIASAGFDVSVGTNTVSKEGGDTVCVSELKPRPVAWVDEQVEAEPSGRSTGEDKDAEGGDAEILKSEALVVLATCVSGGALAVCG